MTITIARPVAPKALPADHPLRRKEQPESRRGESNSSGTSQQFTTSERQHLAFAYHRERGVYRLLGAYLRMSRFELLQLIDRLQKLPKDKVFTRKGGISRLEVAQEALKGRTQTGFEMPQQRDIPVNSRPSYQREFCVWAIQIMEARLQELRDNAQTFQERTVLSKQLHEFETWMQKLGGKPKPKPESDTANAADDQQKPKQKQTAKERRMADQKKNNKKAS